jgi:hypothetical protein
LDGQPPKRETPHPSELGGEKGNGADISTGHTDGVSGVDSTVSIREYRARRFTTQRAIALICRAEAKVQGVKFPGDMYRVVDCMWCRIGDVSVMRSTEHNRAHYKGLQTCGSIWLCPICASKIEERRRGEIVQVFDWAKGENLDSSLITNTFSHGQGDDLHDLFKRQARALKTYRTSRAYVREMARIGYVAMVRSLEITHGKNGFHPHTHEVQFHREKLTPSDAQQLREVLVQAWLPACKKAGLFKSEDDEFSFYRRAIDVRANFTSGDYLAKQDDSKSWTPAHELAKSSSKLGRRSGAHPFVLATRGNPGDSELFLEYVKATKGKRKLLFSPGLKAKAGLQDVSDQEIAAADVEAARLIANLSPRVWNFIKQTDRRHNTRAALLDAAECNGSDGISELLHDLGFDPT